MAAGAATLVGQMPPCNLGRNKLTRYRKWKDWIQDAENKMTFMGLTTDPSKISFIRSCAGAELTEFWNKEARIRFTAVPADEARAIAAQDAHTYEEIKDETKKALLKLVSRDRAIIELLRLEQGSRSFIDYLSEVEDQEYLCRIEEQPITSDDLKRMSLIAGMKDRTLAEKALAEEYNLTQLIQAGINRESSRANVEAMKAKPTPSVNKLEDTDMDHKLDQIRSDLENVMRVRQSGKYSGRYKAPEPNINKEKACQKCTYTHATGRCPADGRHCNACRLEGHFARSPLCKGEASKKKKPRFTARRVEDETPTPTDESEEEWEPVARIDRVWPGVQSGTTKTKDIQCVKPLNVNQKSKRVSLEMGRVKVQLYCDTGSRLTIIPPALYRDCMGQVVPAKCHLRAWGSDTYLDTKGMFKTTLVTPRGARTTTWVYIVAGTRPEPLLGDQDAESLGIIKYNPKGRPATALETEATVNHVEQRASIPAKLRRAGITVCTEKPKAPQMDAAGKKEAKRITKEYTGSVMSDRIGCMKTTPVKLQYQQGFTPTQPPRYPVPFHYRERVTAHLKKLKSEGIIEDVDPAEPTDCILNLAISEKKTAGAIRMNIDARPINIGAKHTKYHVTTPQEVRHELEDATVFTELDMVNGFHQVPLDPESQIVFQSHLGLHRMKRLFFGPKNSSGIFHHEVRKAFAGVPGCITIHDNILVHGTDVANHNQNLLATFIRAKERGITFKVNQATICSPEVKWFGRIFSGAGISADPTKIDILSEAGRPESIQDVKSLLQAAAYNAKFAFDHQEDTSYEEVTAPLRELLIKDAKFVWNDRREKSYRTLLRMMTDKSILMPFKMGRATHLVTDASPHGISASLYQEDESKRWLPVDHISRALSQHEQDWKSQIEWESLAKTWGMAMFRSYLIGTKFTSWGDQKPLIPLYNDFTRPASVRINKHRNQVMDLTFTDKYLPGRDMPADYHSRHPAPITHLTNEERSQLMVDDGDDVHVMHVMMADLPAALTVEMLRRSAQTDPVYQRLITAIQNNKMPEDPELNPYTSVWQELSVIEGLVCRGERIVIPNGHLPELDSNIREWIVELGHSGHMGINATKRLLRLRLWFPGMDRMVERKVTSCLPCQAAVDTHDRDPLKPSTVPKEPWVTLYCDHWGPTQDGKYILVIIDALTRYPEVIIVKGTSAEANIHAFSEVFSRHGFPHLLHSDGGPPFNGKDTHLLQQYFQSVGVEHRVNRSAEDPEATGLVEAFMKHIKKIFHTSAVSRLDPYLQMNDHLLQFRATPHPTTGKSPAELMFGRKFQTKLPDLRPNPASHRSDIVEARAADQKAKAAMKIYKDKRSHARPHKIRIGDKVLLKRKTAKHTSVYDPDPYTVTGVWGTQIEAERNGTIKVRDAQRWKWVHIVPPTTFRASQSQVSQYLQDPDIGAPHQQHETEPSHVIPAPIATPGVHTRDVLAKLRQMPDVILADTPANRPVRNRRAPERYSSATYNNPRHE